MTDRQCSSCRRRRRGLSAVLVALGVAAALPAPAQEMSLDPERGVITMAPLLERTTPAVVNISVVAREASSDNPLFRDPFFRRFFDLPAQPEPRRSISAGSGVIVDARRGLVLTNHHVVRAAERFRQIPSRNNQGIACRPRRIGQRIEVLRVVYAEGVEGDRHLFLYGFRVVWLRRSNACALAFGCCLKASARRLHAVAGACPACEPALRGAGTPQPSTMGGA